MAEGITFVCDQCGRQIEAWEDGNPYFIDSQGTKRYAYHPNRERDRCSGNDVPHICLTCAALFMVDSGGPQGRCNECKSSHIIDTFSLGGQRCPFCKIGAFEPNSNSRMVS